MLTLEKGKSLSLHNCYCELFILLCRKSAQPVFDSQSSVSIPSHLPDHIGGYRAAHFTFARVESRYGLVFPRSGPQE